MKLELQPISWTDACHFIIQYHRHHLPPQGWKYGVAVTDGTKIVGVATVGRPVARHLDDGLTLEVTRNCTDGTPNCASMLYGACARVAWGLGYKRLITYTLASEGGISPHAAGYKLIGSKGGGTWNRPKMGRVRVDKHPTGQKCLWETRLPRPG